VCVCVCCKLPVISVSDERQQSVSSSVPPPQSGTRVWAEGTLAPRGPHYISAHFSRILRPRIDFFSGCNDMFLFFSRLSSSWNSSFTLWLVLADVSMKWQPHRRASASPSSADTSRVSFSSHLLPTNMIGIDGSSDAPFVSLITCRQSKPPVTYRYYKTPPPRGRFCRFAFPRRGRETNVPPPESDTATRAANQNCLLGEGGIAVRDRRRNTFSNSRSGTTTNVFSSPGNFSVSLSLSIYRYYYYYYYSSNNVQNV